MKLIYTEEFKGDLKKIRDKKIQTRIKKIVQSGVLHEIALYRLGLIASLLTERILLSEHIIISRG